MKNIYLLFLLFSLASCVVSKRKYQPGYHLAHLSGKKSSNTVSQKKEGLNGNKTRKTIQKQMAEITPPIHDTLLGILLKEKNAVDVSPRSALTSTLKHLPSVSSGSLNPNQIKAELRKLKADLNNVFIRKDSPLKSLQDDGLQTHPDAKQSLIFGLLCLPGILPITFLFAAAGIAFLIPLILIPSAILAIAKGKKAVKEIQASPQKYGGLHEAELGLRLGLIFFSLLFILFLIILFLYSALYSSGKSPI